MGSLQDQLQQNLIRPQEGEIWRLPDKEVRLHSDGRVDKVKRMVIVMGTMTFRESGLVHIVPISNSGKDSDLAFPLSPRNTEMVHKGHTLTETSKAIIPFYQPIERQFFTEQIGAIDRTTFSAIKRLLCLKVVGCGNLFDLSLR